MWVISYGQPSNVDHVGGLALYVFQDLNLVSNDALKF